MLFAGYVSDQICSFVVSSSRLRQANLSVSNLMGLLGANVVAMTRLLPRDRCNVSKWPVTVTRESPLPVLQVRQQVWSCSQRYEGEYLVGAL